MLFSKTPKRDYLTPANTHKPWFREQQRAAKPHNHRLLILTSFLCFLLGVVVSPLSRAESGEMMLQSVDGESSPALLHSTDVDLQVNGMIAHVTYSQKFTNTSNEWKHAVYTFPLNENAAINSMEMRIGDRIIRGQIKPKAEAKEAFEAAKKAGKKASLTEQQRPNLFTQQVANIAPGEEITVTLQYVQQVDYRDGRFTFHLPTTLTPRYSPGIPLNQFNENIEAEISGTGWGEPTDQVPDARAITPYMREGNEGPQLTFNATLNTGLTLNSVTSRNHRVNWSESTGNYLVTFNQSNIKMDRDIWLEWQPSPSSAPQAAIFTESKGQHDYALVMLMPPQVKSQDLQDFDRDITFVIDTSGSMGGRPIVDAKESLQLAIDRLSEKDRFNVVAFDNDTTRLFETSVEGTTRNKQYARDFVKHLNAGGGTEMAPALNAALKRTTTKDFIKQVVFITDGAVGNEAALFSQIKNELGDARLFTVGIGSAPNSYFMTRAAQFGRGSYVFVSNTADIKQQMDSLLYKLESPVLSDLSLTLPAGYAQSAEIYPSKIPDLYAGVPLLLNVKLPHNAGTSGKITLQGALVDKQGTTREWTRSVAIAPTSTGSTQHLGVATAWARKKVAALMDEKALGRNVDEVKQDILAVALPHKLITEFTSFVAIEEKIANTQRIPSSTENVRNLMPQGTQFRQISYPQTAAGVSEHVVLGMIAILLLSLFHSIAFLRNKGGTRLAP